MTYIKVKWIHDSLEYPEVLYSELDDDRYEIRKVEIYKSGTIGFVNEHRSYQANLGECPIPEPNEINNDPQFQCTEISKTEFEEVWEAAIRNLSS